MAMMRMTATGEPGFMGAVEVYPERFSGRHPVCVGLGCRVVENSGGVAGLGDSSFMLLQPDQARAVAAALVCAADEVERQARRV